MWSCNGYLSWCSPGVSCQLTELMTVSCLHWRQPPASLIVESHGLVAYKDSADGMNKNSQQKGREVANSFLGPGSSREHSHDPLLHRGVAVGVVGVPGHESAVDRLIGVLHRLMAALAGAVQVSQAAVTVHFDRLPGVPVHVQDQSRPDVLVHVCT